MRLIFIYGPVASGKLTIGRVVAAATGFALFHNHLVVDAVSAVFPFGSAEFIQLRERFWLETIAAAARSGRSLVFTFAPEPSVAADFPARLEQVVRGLGGNVLYVAIGVDDAEQERRLVSVERAAFGKLRSVELLRQLRPGMALRMAAMPPAALHIDSGSTSARDAAAAIILALGG